MGTALTVPAHPQPPFELVAGDDWVVVFDPDDAASASAMQEWSDPIIVVRSGPTKASSIVLTSQGGEPSIILTGWSFPDGLEVPATDFSVPVLSWAVLSASTSDLVTETAGKLPTSRDLYLELEVLDNGVRLTKLTQRIRVFGEMAVRGD